MMSRALQLTRIASARFYARLGWTGCAGMGLLIVATSISAWTHQANLALASPVSPTKHPDSAEAVAFPPTTTPPSLPRSDESIQILRMLESEAKINGLAWPQAEYRITPISDESLSAFEVQTTLKGTYPQLRKLIAELLDKQPALALRELNLSRSNGDALDVTAKLRWAVFLADGWPPANRNAKP